MEKIKTVPSILKEISKNIDTKNLYLNLLQGVSITSIIFGALISALGLYSLASGHGISFIIENKKPLAIDPILAGLLTSLSGIILAFEGTGLMKAYFETSTIITISIIFGYLTLNIPATLLGLGYSLFGSITAVVFGYLWCITVILWLQRGE
jgi:hypothetical protein